jgi:hypothetical protein
LAVVAIASGAEDSLLHVRRAQALLGPDVWSRIIEVENDSLRSPYPARLHALVFELADVLWFYSDVDGTQSFSLHRGRLAQEKADFAPLLRDIEPGFTRWRVIENGPLLEEAEGGGEMLPNGCFIESVAALRRLVEQGATVSSPGLLSYYAKSSQRPQGHTVLTYLVPGRVMVVDPLRPDTPLGFPATLARDPKRLARAIQGPEIDRARVLPLELPGRTAARTFATAQAADRGEVSLE